LLTLPRLKATWYIKSTIDLSNDRIIQLGLFNRKANLARIQRPVGFRVEFGDDRTYFISDNVADIPELAEKMSLANRIREALKRGPMTADEIAAHTGVQVKRITETAKRNNKLFLVDRDGKICNLFRG
jgi:predicted XRE-type DNA-binding protein